MYLLILRKRKGKYLRAKNLSRRRKVRKIFDLNLDREYIIDQNKHNLVNFQNGCFYEL